MTNRWEPILVAGRNNWVTFAYTPSGAPVITTSALPDGSMGDAYSATIAAIGDPTITFSIISGALPTGLSLSATTGAITGTVGAIGVFTITARATNGVGADDQVLVITVPNTISGTSTLQDVAADALTATGSEGADTATLFASSTDGVGGVGIEGGDTGTSTASYVVGVTAAGDEGGDFGVVNGETSSSFFAVATEGEDVSVAQIASLEFGIDLSFAEANEGEDTAVAAITVETRVEAAASEGEDTASAGVTGIVDLFVTAAASEGEDTAFGHIATDGWVPKDYFSYGVRASLDGLEVRFFADASIPSTRAVLDTFEVSATA